MGKMNRGIKNMIKEVTHRSIVGKMPPDKLNPSSPEDKSSTTIALIDHI
jgi:hypothetical protein